MLSRITLPLLNYTRRQCVFNLQIMLFHFAITNYCHCMHMHKFIHHSFTVVRHSSLSLVISCAIEIFLYFSSAYLSLDKDSITSFLVVLSRNSINKIMASLFPFLSLFPL